MRRPTYLIVSAARAVPPGRTRNKGILRIRPGLLILLAFVLGVWVWQTRFREYTPFSGPTLEQTQKAEFKRYALSYYPIRELEYHGKNEVWVRLKVGSKLDPVDTQRIVDEIAEDYGVRTGTTDGFTVYMLHPVHQEVLARRSM